MITTLTKEQVAALYEAHPEIENPYYPKQHLGDGLTEESEILKMEIGGKQYLCHTSPYDGDIWIANSFQENDEYVKCDNEEEFVEFLIAYEWGEDAEKAKKAWLEDTGIEFSEIQGKWFCQIKGRVYLKED